MANYVATVEIEFDDEDLKDMYGDSWNRADVHDILFGELQNFTLGSPWIKQITRNGRNTITNLDELEER